MIKVRVHFLNVSHFLVQGDRNQLQQKSDGEHDRTDNQGLFSDLIFMNQIHYDRIRYTDLNPFFQSLIGENKGEVSRCANSKQNVVLIDLTLCYATVS